MKLPRPTPLTSFALLIGALFLTEARTLSAPQQGGKTGTIDLLYIRADWADRPMGITDATWQNRLDAIHQEAQDYWVFHSSGVVTDFVSTVTPKLLFSGPAPTAAQPIEPFDVRSQMVSLAQAAGFVMNDFDHIVLSYPSVPHTFSFGALGTPGTVWMPGSNPWGPGFIHEMGHAFGVGHASHLEGGASILPGEHREGRDGLFMMGSEGDGILGGRSTINMPMRFRMGHTLPENIVQASSPGVYRLYEFELSLNPAGKATAIRLDLAGDAPGDWWVSFAPTMVPRWANFDSIGFGRGVIVQRLQGSRTQSLDFTPQSMGGIGTNEEDYIDSRDGALQIGDSFQFPGTNVTLEPLTTGVTDGLRWIEVDVSFGEPEIGPLLVREEFDGYAPGDIDGQGGLGIGLEGGTWSQSQGSGTFEIVPGLSGANAVALDSAGDQGGLRIEHNLVRWGSGKLWMSCLFSETTTGGHFWLNGAVSFSGAIGHPWGNRTFAVNNVTAPGNVSFGLGETHRLIALFDWDSGRTTLWIDETSEPVTDPGDPGFAPAAHKLETPPPGGSELFLAFAAGTEGVVDDLRIGTTFESVVEPGVEYCLAEACPCGNDGSVSGCANSTGSGASLRSDGSASVSLDDLSLRVENAPANAPSLLFMGGAPALIPLGDGNRCVGAGAAGLCRFPVRVTGSGGQASWSQLVATSQASGPACAITAGTTWYFQGWYRDANGPCGSGYNLSSARSVLFVP